MTVIVPLIVLLLIGVFHLVSGIAGPTGEAVTIGYVDELGGFQQSTSQGSITLVRFDTPDEALSGGARVLRLRQAYGALGPVTAGFLESLFRPTFAESETLDFGGTVGYAAVRKALSQPAVRERYRAMGVDVLDMSQPEFAAYVNSPHSRVACVECHIGPGAGWFVKSKLSGTWQVFAVTFGTFERPIPVPVRNLRPARETCEQCHWPTKFVGDKLSVRTHYQEDEKNTEVKSVLVLRVGGADVVERAGAVATIVLNRPATFGSESIRAEIVTEDGVVLTDQIGGGALTREKIVAAVARKFICIADASKVVETMGRFPLPVEVIPMARSLVARRLVAKGGRPVWREGFRTDNGNEILDVHNLKIEDPAALEARIGLLTGVVEVGLFARRGAALAVAGPAATHGREG